MCKILLTVCLLMLLFSFSCHKKPLELNKSEGFPNSVGTFWRYAVIDSINQRIDTLVIRIVGTGTLDNNEPVTIWQKTSLYDGTDSDYVSVTKAGVTIYPNRLSNSFDKKYIFPLQVGSFWINQNIRDTSKVSAVTTKKVIAGSFQNAYKIVRDFITPPGYNKTYDEDWFVPNIGVIYRNFEDQTLWPVSQHWELLNYHIAQ